MSNHISPAHVPCKIVGRKRQDALNGTGRTSPVRPLPSAVLPEPHFRVKDKTMLLILVLASFALAIR